jgi:putative MATE family efflux protein
MASRTDFTISPIPHLVRKLAIPTSVGFFFNTMFNVVDTYYAGTISTSALAGLSLSFPVFFIILSLGMGIGTGTTALIANSLGRGDEPKAKIYAQQAVSFGFLISFFLAAIGYLTIPYLFKFMNAEGEVLQLALEYMNVVLVCTVFFLLNGILNGVLSARGDTVSFRNFLIGGSILNIGLDPVLMYGWFGLPAMGVAGIALATVIIQFFGTVYMFYRVSRNGFFSPFGVDLFKPKKAYFKEIAQQGFPASLSTMTVAVGIFIITYFISFYGKLGVAAYGIATRIEQIALLPTIGLNVAALTIAGQNFGAGLIERIRETHLKNLKYGVIVSTIGMMWVFLFSHQIMALFTDDTEVVEIGSTYLKIATIVFNSYVLMNISIAVLQGIKKPLFAIWIGLYRQIIMPVLLFPILAHVFDFRLMGIWWGIAAINWSAAIFSIVYTHKILREMKPVLSKTA